MHDTDDIAERYGRTHVVPPSGGDPDLTTNSSPLTDEDINAANESIVPRALANLHRTQMARLKSGLKADLKPAQAALQNIESATTDDALRNALLSLDLRHLETQTLNGTGTEQAMEVLIAAEFLAGLAQTS